uniref:Endonuclease-reverse transcriptase n=1 Tax=Bombyx mori TaxID=7091 RepID=A0A8R2R333_BOMMO|nr:uncharacterized protein LOC119629390 [Bombyx mori]XP_037871614.1 uncharacterized protein LOC119629555 [Bombyx mori]
MEEQFQLLFDKMKIEMKNQSESITNTIMNKMDEKLKPILEENKYLKLKVENLEKKIEILERDKKTNNIIIHGLTEDEKSTPELIDKVKDTITKELGIAIENYEFNKIYRIGKTNKGNPSKVIRPILICLTTGWKKAEILKNKRKLKDLHITEDYSKETLEKRKALLPQLMEERRKGNFAYLRYDKLIIKENKYVKDSRKRELSISPQTNSQSKKIQPSTSAKNNRTNAFDLMRGRSNSFTTLTTGQKQ